MQLRKLLLISSLSLLISGCSIFTKTEYVEVPVEVYRNINIVERPNPVSLNGVRFYVVTEDNFEEFKERFKNDHGSLVFYAISVLDYENIALNVAELKRYIEQQKNIIIYYEDSVRIPENNENNK